MIHSKGDKEIVHHTKLNKNALINKKKLYIKVKNGYYAKEIDVTTLIQYHTTWNTYKQETI